MTLFYLGSKQQPGAVVALLPQPSAHLVRLPINGVSNYCVTRGVGRRGWGVRRLGARVSD